MLKKSRFKTSDGYVLTFDESNRTWGDGDLLFGSSDTGYPIDDEGGFLSGTIMTLEPVIKNISLTRNYQIDVSIFSAEQWKNIEHQLYDNDIDIQELSEMMGIDIESKCPTYFECDVS